MPDGRCSYCGAHEGHTPTCALQPGVIEKVGAVDELTPEVNDAIGWDDRKDLAEVWQTYAPLPAQGLTESTYDALLHVAKYGARRALENRR